MGLCSNVEAQSEMDSLKALLRNTQDSPTKLQLYGKLSWAYAITHTELKQARQYADSLKILAERVKDESEIERSNFYYGLIARFEGRYQDALKYLEPFCSYFTSIGDSARLASGLFQVGVINHDLGNYQKSLSAYYRVLGIRKNMGDTYAVGYTLNAIGVIFNKMHRYNEAIQTYSRAITIFDSLQAKQDKAGTLTNLANVYSSTRQYDKAQKIYSLALLIDREIDSKDGEAFDLENIGNMLNLLQQYDSALKYHLLALSIREGFPQKEQTATSLNLIGYTYTKLGNYDLADKYLLKSKQLADEIHGLPLLRDIFFNLSELYAARKNFAKAFEFQRSFSVLKDSILNESTSKQLMELQLKYETSEKDKQIMVLASEKKIQEKETERQATLKNAAGIGFILIVILAGLTFYIIQQRFRNQRALAEKNNEIKEVNFQRQLSELEMKALRAQINPHFLFNCMNSINKMILNGESENASLYLTKFSKLVRLILENTESGNVSLENELALIMSYIDLEALRFKGRIGYSISVAESIEKESTYLPAMVLQPFVENAIWHGLMHKGKDEKGIISIDIKEANDKLICTIEDNGVGRAKAQQLKEKSVLKSTSMGIKITEERLRLLTRERLDNLILITDLKDSFDHALGTRIELNIPIV